MSEPDCVLCGEPSVGVVQETGDTKVGLVREVRNRMGGEALSGKDIKRGMAVPWGKVKGFKFKAQEGCLAGGPHAVATRNQEIGFQAGVVAGWEARKSWEEEHRMDEIVKQRAKS